MNINEKLCKIQTTIKAPKNLYNSFGKYKYRNAEGICEAVKPFLEKYGCVLILEDEIVEVCGRIYVKAISRFIDVESGESTVATAYAREAESKKGQDDSQITGTASSYARKYALNGLFLLDDTKDADSDEYHNQTNKAEKKETEEQKAEAEQKKIESSVISEVKVKSLIARCEKDGVDIARLQRLYHVNSFAKLNELQFRNISDNWEKIKVM